MAHQVTGGVHSHPAQTVDPRLFIGAERVDEVCLVNVGEGREDEPEEVVLRWSRRIPGRRLAADEVVAEGHHVWPSFPTHRR